MASVIFNNVAKSSAVFQKTSMMPDKAFFDRVSELEEKHNKLFFKSNSLRYFSSPGRIELCGNHTDHQNGMVLCAAVNLDTLAVVNATNNSLIRISSDGYPIIEVDLNSLELVKKEIGTSTALVKGVCKYFVDNGAKVGGFTACANSNVFRGAGISSSASFELLIASILNSLYNDNSLSATFNATAAHYAESVYFGKPCGLLDQCAIAFGSICFIDFKTGEPDASVVNATLPLSVILVNTEGNHSELTNEYASIRSEMNEVAKFFGKNVLSEVAPLDFTEALPKLRKAVSGRALLRAIHFFREQERVLLAKKSLEENDVDSFCNCINESGNSSLAYLQNCFPQPDTAQVIPSAVEVLRSLDGVKAARVHGGGFAGTVLALAETEKLPKIKEVLNYTFGSDNYFIVDIRPTGATEITKEINNDRNSIS